jgi:hypothetical protein
MLRVGVMLDSCAASAWIAKFIEDLQASEFGRLELVILNRSTAPGSSSFTLALGNPWNIALFRCYEQWDYQRNKAGIDALAVTDLAHLPSQAPTIPVHPKCDGRIETIPENELAEIRKHDLDVILCFDFGDLQGGILKSARYGVWLLNPNDPTDRRSAPLFWELYRRNPVSRSSLQLLSDSPGGSRILYESFASTDHTSLYRNRNPIYWKTAEITLRLLRDLDLHGVGAMRPLAASTSGAVLPQLTNPAPNSLRMLLFMGRHASRWLQARLTSLQSGSLEKWCIAIRRRTADHRFDDPTGYRIMPSANNRFYADPFLIEKDGKTLLFFEDLPFVENRGVISYCELQPDGTPGMPIEVLRRPYHLSYPFVFEHAGEMYMIPETKGNRTVELYRATDFPTVWAADAILLDNIHAVDATIHERNGKYWMFAAVSNGRYSNCDELCIFFANALRGPWTPHPRNPVLSDVRRARPAGPLFYEQGRLIRPSQDCGKAYGYALVFSEVLKLTETEYEERPFSRLDPNLVPGQIGNHTYSRTDRFEVIDLNAPEREQGK